MREDPKTLKRRLSVAKPFDASYSPSPLERELVGEAKKSIRTNSTPGCFNRTIYKN